jgi:PAS domain-containing protein
MEQPTNIFNSMQAVHDEIHELDFPAWIFNEATLKIVDANQPAMDFCMYEQHEIIGLSISDLWHGEDLSDLINDLASHNNEGSFFGNLKHKKKNGDIVVMHVRATRMLFPKKMWVVHLVSKMGIVQ